MTHVPMYYPLRRAIRFNNTVFRNRVLIVLVILLYVDKLILRYFAKYILLLYIILLLFPINSESAKVCAHFNGLWRNTFYFPPLSSHQSSLSLVISFSDLFHTFVQNLYRSCLLQQDDS